MKKIALIFVFICNFYITIAQDLCNIKATLSSPITLVNRNNVIIEGKRITSFTDCISIKSCNNITIRNCILGPSVGNGIDILNSRNIKIENCSFESNQTGIYAQNCQSIEILKNKFSNPQGPFPRGQFVQFNDVTGEGNRINYNVGEAQLGFSYPEDLINIYKSSGEYNDPLQIIGNVFRGGGPSQSGGGIMTGDGGQGGNVVVKNNILVYPGQYGIANAGGYNIKLNYNKIFGKQQCFTNVGMYIWDVYNSGNCTLNEIIGNQVNYTGYSYGYNPYWNAGDCLNITERDNIWNAPIDETILPLTILCPDLMLHYHYNGNYNDISGNNLNSIGSNTSFVTEEGIGQSLFFNGSNSYTTIVKRTSQDYNNNSFLKPVNDKITVSLWIKPFEYGNTNNGNNNVRGVLQAPDSDGWSSGWRIAIVDNNVEIRMVTQQYPVNNGNSSNYLRPQTTDSGNITYRSMYMPGLNLNVWNHIVFTYDGKELKSYINGECKGNIPLEGKIFYDRSDNMYLGNTNGTGYFKGLVDELKLYRGNWSEEDVRKEYGFNKIAFQKKIIVHYPFDDDSNTIAVDKSENNINGNKFNIESKNEGKIKASRFNGINSYIDTSNRPSIKPITNFTISVWIKPIEFNGRQAVIKGPDCNGWDHGWRITLSNNDIEFRVVTNRGTQSIYANQVLLNEWSHIAFTYDGYNLKGYVNGDLVGSLPLIGLVYYDGSNSPMWLGTSFGTNTFNGLIDDFKMYKNALLFNEVKENYNNEKIFYSDLLAYYPFNDNLLDESGNGLHGSNNGIVFKESPRKKSANFSGGEDYIRVANSFNKFIDNKNAVTVSAWIKPLNFFTTGQGIIKAPNSDGWTSGWRIAVFNNNIEFRVVTERGAYSIYAGQLELNEWNQVALTYDGYNLKGYINGELVGIQALSGDIYYSFLDDMLIGYSNGTNFFKGEIDDVKVFKKALNINKISEIFQNRSSLQTNFSSFNLQDKISDQNNIEEIESSEVLIYPNPASKEVNCLITNLIQDNSFQVEVYNNLGKKVPFKILDKKDNAKDYSFHLNVSNLSNGIYTMRVIIQEKILTKLFVVSN